MPEKIELADGTEREVPTAEELEALNSNATSLEEQKTLMSTLRETMGVDEGADITEALKELKEAENPNFKAMREKMKALKAKGVNTDDDVVETDAKPAAGDMSAAIEEALQKRDTAKKLAEFSDEERALIEPVLEKMSAVDGDNSANFDIAVGMLFPDKQIDPLKKVISSAGGGAPRPQTSKDVSDDLKTFGKTMGLTDEDFDKVK